MQSTHSTKHRQMFVKVNVPVDVGVSDLIVALSEFPRLQTIESCQGEGSRPGNRNSDPWVCFRYGNYWEHPWKELANFIFDYLGPKLVQELGDRVSVVVRLTECGDVQAELWIRPGALEKTIATLERLAQELAA